MNTVNAIEALRYSIDKELIPLIGNKCALYDVPYYKNIGDILIWEGELSFLKKNNIEILDMADYHTYTKRIFSKEVTILFQGGGNLGDLYHEHVDLLLRLVEDYPDNRIIVFSQTIKYYDNGSFLKDFSILSAHKDLHVVARDYKSLEAIKNIKNIHAHVLPDMAFYIDIIKLRSKVNLNATKKLYIKRNDVEMSESYDDSTFDRVSDWPCFEKKIMYSTLRNTLYDRAFRFFPFLRPIIRESWKKYAYNTFREHMINEGLNFLSPYGTVMSERLHGCILAILLNRKVVVVNNSYGKNLDFYDAWLKKFDNVTMLNR